MIVDVSGFAAIQCKFYAPEHRIQKTDIDSFVSAASSKEFVSLVLVDTTLHDLSPNAQSVLDNADRDYHRIALSDLEKSRVNWATYFREDRVELLQKKHGRYKRLVESQKRGATLEALLAKTKDDKEEKEEDDELEKKDEVEEEEEKAFSSQRARKLASPDASYMVLGT